MTDSNEAYLRILTGPSQGMVFVLKDLTVFELGRGSGCQVRLEDPAVAISHARIYRKDGSWVFFDLNSERGSSINDIKVERRDLEGMEVIRVGKTELIFTFDPPTGNARQTGEPPPELTAPPPPPPPAADPAPAPGVPVDEFGDPIDEVDQFGASDLDDFGPPPPPPPAPPPPAGDFVPPPPPPPVDDFAAPPPAPAAPALDDFGDPLGSPSGLEPEPTDFPEEPAPVPDLSQPELPAGYAGPPPAADPAPAPAPKNDEMRPSTQECQLEGSMRLVVIDGDSQDHGKTFDLEGQEEVTIGRGSQCGLVLWDRKVSRAHCRIENRDGNFILADLGSSNGTIVNGDRVKKTVLQAGDYIRLGFTVISYQWVPSKIEA